MPQHRGRIAFAAGVAAGFLAAGAVFAAAGLGAIGIGGGVNIAPAFFFGGHMVRAEAIVKIGGVTHDFRLDRGAVRAVSAGSITLKERTGDLVTIPVSPTADVRVGQRSVSVSQLRKGLMVLVVRDGDAPAAWIRVGG
jgi:hypothetical protein